MYLYDHVMLMYTCILMRRTSFQVIAIDLNASRLTMAKSLGATHTIHINRNTDSKSVIAQIKEAAGGGVDFAFDTSKTSRSYIYMIASVMFSPHVVA